MNLTAQNSEPLLKSNDSKRTWVKPTLERLPLKDAQGANTHKMNDESGSSGS